MIWILGFFELIADVGISQYTKSEKQKKNKELKQV